jgi:peptide deformylase
MEEGCLSVPDYQAEVTRYQKVKVRGLDLQGKSLELDAEGLLAVVLQHEIDHVNGKLFIDHLSRLKRELCKRRLLKRRAKETS